MTPVRRALPQLIRSLIQDALTHGQSELKEFINALEIFKMSSESKGLLIFFSSHVQRSVRDLYFASYVSSSYSFESYPLSDEILVENHHYLADYFLGTYAGSNTKPFINSLRLQVEPRTFPDMLTLFSSNWVFLQLARHRGTSHFSHISSRLTRKLCPSESCTTSERFRSFTYT